jgi:hypothetical protein
MVEEAQLKFAVSAYTGVACSLHKCAQTIHTLFGFPKHRKKDSRWNSQLDVLDTRTQALQLRKLKDLAQDLDYLIFDEVSMIDAVVVGHISSRLCEVTGNSLPFGGINVIFVGDYWQLSPVMGNPIFKDMLMSFGIIPNDSKDTDYTNPQYPRQIGVQCFLNFEKFELQENVRSKDTAHTSHLEALRSFGVKGGVTVDLITSLKRRILTSCDYDSDPAWYDAPICVTSNTERNYFTSIMAKNFALKNGVHIVTWNLTVESQVSQLISQKEYDQVFTFENGTLGIFVQDAPSYISQNINPLYGLANGTFVRMHSLTFENEQDQEDFNNLIADAVPGERVHLQMKPSFINVAFQPKPNVIWPVELNLDSEPANSTWP